MQKNTSITLTEHFEKFIASMVESGQFASASETVRAGLRLLEKQQEEHLAKLTALRQALREGEESGYIENFDFDRFMKEMDDELDQK